MLFRSVEVHVAGLDHRRRRVIVNHAVVVENIRIGNDDISCRRLRRDMRKAVVEAAEELLRFRRVSDGSDRCDFCLPFTTKYSKNPASKNSYLMFSSFGVSGPGLGGSGLLFLQEAKPITNTAANSRLKLNTFFI